jgi:hypothetical protein
MKSINLEKEFRKMELNNHQRLNPSKKKKISSTNKRGNSLNVSNQGNAVNKEQLVKRFIQDRRTRDLYLNRESENDHPSLLKQYQQ